MDTTKDCQIVQGFLFIRVVVNSIFYSSIFELIANIIEWTSPLNLQYFEVVFMRGNVP